jgi:hypothetical protein
MDVNRHEEIHAHECYNNVKLFGHFCNFQIIIAIYIENKTNINMLMGIIIKAKANIDVKVGCQVGFNFK